jgi:hypothetical protein
MQVIVLRASAAIAAIVALTLLGNAFDEDLRPEVKAYLEAQAPLVPDERNGYFQMVGLAADTVAPHAAGRRYLAEVTEAQQKSLAGRNVDWPRMKALPLPQLRDETDFCTLDFGRPCLANVRAAEPAARKLLAEGDWLLARYRAMLEYPEYAEAQDLKLFTTPMPSFLPLLTGQKLFHAQAVLRLREGRAVQVAYDLERSLAFSRKMLAGSQTVIGKMIAVAHARRAALFASEILPVVAKADPSILSRLAGALAPLSSAERSLAEPFRADFAVFGSVVRLCDPQVAWCYFLQPNATVNRHYRVFQKPLMAMDAAPADQFDKLRAELQAAGESFPWWSILYNPHGKWLLRGLSESAHWDYVARMHDLDGVFRIVALQALIAAKRVPAAKVPEFLAQGAKRYGDPYSGQAMGWDDSRRQLWFQPRATSHLQNVGGVEKRFSAGLI